MVKIFRLILIAAVILFQAAYSGAAERPKRGMFVSVIQEPETLSCRGSIIDLVSFAKEADVDILFVQVYRANMAWFPSKVGDDSPYRACLARVGEDPLGLLIDEAHAKGIEVHAWLNLLSLSKNKNARLLKKYGPGILTRDRRPKSVIEDYEIDNQYFLEPGDPRVRRELGEMVGEIVERYPLIDGLQFDYIRYPDKDPHYGYTEKNMARFREATGIADITEGSPAWDRWKRTQVTELLKELLASARAKRPGIKLSTTGCAPYARAYYEAFQDWPSWLSDGMIDFVTVMTYYKDPSRFARSIDDALKRVGDPSVINIAVGAYELAGSPEIFSTQLGACRASAKTGIAIFHYGSLVGSPELARVFKETR